MVRNYIKKRPNLVRYTEENLMNAVHDVLNKNKSYRQAQEAYNVPIAVIFHRIKGRKNPMNIMSGGRRPVLPMDVEVNLANCLAARARMGFPCNEKELCLLVSEYIAFKSLKTPFKNNIPGHDWYLSFMARHPNLSFKKPEHLQKIRKDARDPFVVYDFYNKLRDLVVEKSLSDPSKANFVFNTDESGFNSDPCRVRAIGEKGKTLSRVSGGSGRESTTVLACIAADGSYLPPFILFKGSAVQARWVSGNPFPGTLYGASKNGWMEESHFYHWFVTLFVPHIESLRLKYEVPTQTALLLFDGHSSHVSVRIVAAALEYNISLFRFPSHLTDRIQPLDKCVFGPVKLKWNQLLVGHGKAQLGTSSGRLSKREFVELLSQVWVQGITKENIISGFKNTGIFPVDSGKFTEDYFDPLKLKKYKEMIASSSEKNTLRSNESTQGTSIEDQNNHNSTFQNKGLPAVVIGQPSPNHIVRIFCEQLQEANTSATDILDETVPKKVVPRLKQSTYGEVLTTPEVMKRLQEAEQKKIIKETKVKKTNKMSDRCENDIKTKVKKKLKFSDTVKEPKKMLCNENESDDDDLPLSFHVNQKRSTSPTLRTVEYKEVKWDDLQKDTFILAKFKGFTKSTGRKSPEYKYVCVVDQKDDDDGEIGIVGLRSFNETCRDFYINETTISFININMVEAILPKPETKFVGRKIVYSFAGCVNVFEKP